MCVCVCIVCDMSITTYACQVYSVVCASKIMKYNLCNIWVRVFSTGLFRFWWLFFTLSHHHNQIGYKNPKLRLRVRSRCNDMYCIACYVLYSYILETDRLKWINFNWDRTWFAQTTMTLSQAMLMPDMYRSKSLFSIVFSLVKLS